MKDLAFVSDWPALEVIALQTETFAASEGAEEGAVIGELTANLLATSPGDHVLSCSATAGDTLCANMIFSRLFFAGDARRVYVLGPVAVTTSHQRQGVGQALLRWGLAEVARRGAEIVVTYGDPAYYPKVGFRQVDTSIVPAPFRLTWPEGWMAQSLTDAALTPLEGPVTCVEAFARPDYW